MNGALETSITLEDVFAVVGAKRVPMAPELAGYLALEIAEGADAAGGAVDPRVVFIGEEGSVALVRAKKESIVGDAEGSVRGVLARLLDASGSTTPALAATARKKPGVGLPALVEELEAALIPVNRAAGRRALARLAREVKRVTMGVGRNASQPPSVRGSAPSYTDGRPPASAAQPPRTVEAALASETAGRGSVDESGARRPRGSAVAAGPPAPPQPSQHPPSVIVSQPPDARPAGDDERVEAPPPPRVAEAQLSTVREEASEILARTAIARGDNVSIQAEPTLDSPAPPARARDEVDSLIASFEVSGGATNERAVARELKLMVGLEPTPPPPTPQDEPPSPGPPAPVPDVRASAASFPEFAKPEEDRAPAQRPEPPARPVERRREPSSTRAKREVPAAPPPPMEPSPERQLPTMPMRRRLSTASDLKPSRSRAVAVAVALLVLLAVGALAVWLLKPGFFSGRTPEKVEAERLAAEAEAARRGAAKREGACKATLIVTDVPAHAEVLLRVGQAPADVDRMPVGTRLEFVATAEGYAPKRAVVPSGAAWDHGKDGKPRFEVAVQLDRSKARPGQSDLWPAADPGSAVGGDGPPGTVHVVSTPKGAEIWLLAAVGPEARVEQLRCDEDVDVLVAGPTAFRRRLRVRAAEFAKQESAVQGATVKALVARVSAK